MSASDTNAPDVGSVNALARSEEHTSELQSPCNLVFRLLLEKNRINRIYEGTNEINRLLTVEMTLKRAMQGRLNMMGAAMQVQQALMTVPDFEDDNDAPFSYE